MVSQQILVVEDEAALRYIYDRILTGMGYKVLQAKNGQEAIDLLAVHTPVLVFLDMLLPHVSGLQVLEYIASQPHLAAMHIVIASSATEFEKYTRNYPSAEFRVKPILPTQIREIAQQYMPQPQTE